MGRLSIILLQSRGDETIHDGRMETRSKTDDRVTSSYRGNRRKRDIQRWETCVTGELKLEELRDRMLHESRKEGRSKENSGEMDDRTT